MNRQGETIEIQCKAAVNLKLSALTPLQETSWPNALAFSTNHHHDPVASTAIFVPRGSFLKTP
jgi:hypothetical protein